jgi:hypothetical protein
MNKLNKAKLVFKYFPSLTCLAILAYLDFHLIKGSLNGEHLDEKNKFLYAFLNITLCVVVFLPLINHFMSKIDSKSVDDFLRLPDRDTNIDYIHFYDFLSGLALSAFYITVMMFTFKGVLKDFGWIIAAFYLAVMFLFSVLLGAISLVRFIYPFTRYNTIAYWICAVTSSAVMLAVTQVSMKMIS